MHANIHETEGGSRRQETSIDITLRYTITLHKSCHEAVDRRGGYKMKMKVLDEELGCNGSVEFTGKMANGALIPEPFVSEPFITPQEARMREE